MNYAVFVDGSRQYRVNEGDSVKVDFRDGDEDSAITFDRVLLVRSGADLKVGQPTLAGARVIGTLVDEPFETTTKVYVQHFRRRKNYRRLRGHRQPYRVVQIKHILLAGQDPPAAPETSNSPAAT
jgi:large subunit ribosomal protein L21